MDRDHDYHTLNNLFEFAHNTWSPSSLCDSRPTDLTLVIESLKFHVHKDILKKSSDYFSAMFSSQMTECTKDIIELHVVCPEQFKILIEGFYTGKLELTTENVYSVVQLAQMLQVGPSLQSKYMDFIKYNLIHLEHCLGLMYFCIAHRWQELYCDVRRFCLGHFSELKHTSSLADLSLSELFDYLSDKYLVVEDEVHVVEAIQHWLSVNKKSVPFNSQEFDNFRTKVKKLVSSCVCLNDTLGALDIVTEAVFSDGSLPVDTFQFTLAKRPRQEDVFMFWAMLTSTPQSDGFANVLRFSLDTGHAVKFDTMRDVIEEPGFLQGSELCASGPYVYLSCGGPRYGSTDGSIKHIWRFDVSKPFQRWKKIGDPLKYRCRYSMVILEDKLYIIGGSGKRLRPISNVLSLDLHTGHWDKLPSMPEHNDEPLVAAFDHKIIYVCSNCNVYFFSIITKRWSAVKVCETNPCRLPETRYVAMFPIKASNSDYFAAAAVTYTDGHLRIPLLRIHKETMEVYMREEDTASASTTLDYTVSTIVNGKLVLFLAEKFDFFLFGVRLVHNIKKAVIFDPYTKQFSDMSVHNLKEATSAIALPHFPTTFTMGCVDFNN